MHTVNMSQGYSRFHLENCIRGRGGATGEIWILRGGGGGGA